jgi:hypothetical protein
VSTEPPPKRGITEIIFGSPLSIAGVVGLSVDSIGLAMLAGNLILSGQVEQLWQRFLILAALFFAAIGLMLVGAKGTRLDSAKEVIKFYTYVYSILTAVSYALIAYILSMGTYTFQTYIGFWALLLAQLAAFGILRYFGRATDRGAFALPLITANLFHYTLLVVQYVILRTPIDLSRLMENIVLAVFMSFVSGLLFQLSELASKGGRRPGQRTKL